MIAVADVGWRRRRELDLRVAALRERAAALLGATPEHGGSLAEQIRALVDAIAEVLLTDAVERHRGARLAALAADLQELALDLHRDDASERTLRVAGFGRELRRLHGATGSQGLIGRACEEVRRSCGLERVLMSRVASGRCQPWHANDDSRSEPWFATWVEGEIDLRALSIDHVVAERRPDVIDTTKRENHPMVSLSQTRAYVVAPIMPAGAVVGLFQADHGRHGPPGDETDRDILRVFSDVFAHVYERAFLLERLHAQRRHVHDALALLDGDLDAAVLPWSEPSAEGLAGLDELTAREHDVLALLTRGHGNQAIAEQLAISPRTVKTHVTRILLKLGARNRSEVIARLHGRT
jgi:DNA-binding CsgD family transcriptional regulator